MSPPPVLWLVHADPRAAPTSLDAGERRRALSFTRPEIRSRYVSAHTALRRLLAERLGVAPGQVAFTREPCPVCGAPHGRPAVAGGTAHFSLAYSGGLCLIALADTPVGVDMECIPSPRVVAGLVPELHPSERAELAALPEDERALAFARTWVRKEAYLKGLGTGLARGLTLDYVGTGPTPTAGLPGWTVEDVTVDVSRAAAVALRQS
ncbi:4'-phosphopantetheinyl transferase family protein [Streptomyces sp. NPDC056161]|uniref:4'-phosphopantetheinyl transferase family protein n=1 Tax=Streptomyces sp. NPDC056161 TaxID=3345732 RepID=UPI0035D66311